MSTLGAGVSDDRFQDELRSRLLAGLQVSSPERWLRGAPGADSGLAALREICAAIEASCKGTGSLPPSPKTTRGYLGRLLIRGISRALAWYTLQIGNFHSLVARGFREVFYSVQDLSALNADTNSMLATMREVNAVERDRRLALQTSVDALQIEIRQLRAELGRELTSMGRGSA